jgi:zinc protease
MGAFDMNHRFGIFGKVSGAAVVWLMLVASPARSAEPAPVPQKIVTIEGITEYRLDNGLRVLLFPDPSTQNVTVNLTVFVGSRHEGYGETGMAHLLEHMVFKGTPKHPDVPRALKDHGAQYNGTTWVDRTNYFETMDGTDANLEFGIRLEADRLVNSLIRREDLVSEMTVVRNEFEAGENSPGNVLSQRMLAAAYEWHNYGKSTIGNRSDIERVPIENLQAFYRKHYQPDNAMLVVAGKFEPDKALAHIAKYFGALKRPTRKLDTTYTEEPPQDGERTVVLRRVGKIGAVGAVYHIPAGPHEDFAAVEVLTEMLTSEPSGRLYKALVETKKATAVSGNAFAWHDPGVVEFNVQVGADRSVEEVRDTLIDTLESLSANTITDEEVERAKRKILKYRELQEIRSNRIGVELSEWAAQGDWRLFFLFRDRVAKVNAKDVSRVIAAYLRRNNRTVGLYIPTEKAERAAIPSTPSVESLVKDYRGTQTIAAGEAFDPTPENIEKRVHRFELANGFKMALLPRKTRGESVVVRLTLRYGNDESIKGHTSATQFVASLMTRGTKRHTRQQLQDEWDRLGARMHGGGLLGDASFTLEVRKKNLETALTLLAEVLREPAFPSEEFDVLKREHLSRLEKGLTEPTNLAFREMQRLLNPHPKEDVRYVPTTQESIDRLQQVTAEEVRELYAQQLGAQAGELAVVGDFAPETVRMQFQQMVGDWKAKVPYRRIDRPAKTDIPASRQVIATPDKANAVFTAGHMLAMTDTDPDYPALEVANFLFGGGSMSSRLGNRVRQKEGLSYGVGSQFSADAQDKSAHFGIFAITNPSNIDKVDKAVAEELERLVKDGATVDELTEAKTAYLKQEKVHRASDLFLAAVLVENLANDRTFAFYAELEKKVAALSPAEINAAIRKRWTPGKLVIIHAGDFKKPAAGTE